MQTGRKGRPDRVEEKSGLEPSVGSGQIERALRREIRLRQQAERTLRRQADALSRTRRLLRRDLRWPEFVRAVLHAIIREEQVLWATFWSALPDASGGVRRSFAWRDGALGEQVEAFADRHPRAMKTLARLYEALLDQHRCSVVVGADDSRVPAVVRKFYRQVGAGSSLQVPLLDEDGRLGGWLSCLCAAPRPPADTVAFVEAFALQATLAFDLSAGARARRALASRQEREERNRELAAIHDRLHAGVMSPDQRVDSVLALVLENAGGLLGAPWGMLWKKVSPEDSAPCWILHDGVATKCDPSDPRWAHPDARERRHRLIMRWAMDNHPREVPLRGAARTFFRRLTGPIPTGRLLVVPLHFAGETNGILVFAGGRSLEELAETAQVALESLAIQAALVLGWESVARFGRSAALAEERIRLARDLHDFLAQTFGGISLQVAALHAQEPVLPKSVFDRLGKIDAQARHGAEQLRRTLVLLRSASLEHQSLAVALDLLARNLSATHGVRAQVIYNVTGVVLSPDQELQLYAIASEAMNNALKHSTPALITLTVTVRHRLLWLVVRNTGPMPPRRERSMDGLGLNNMRTRAQSLGGSLRFRRGRAQATVTVRLPLALKN